jgi:hypothetical protein
MTGITLSAPILLGKIDNWKKFSYELAEGGSKHNDYITVMKSSGVKRIRAWLQENPAGAVGIMLYEGETPSGFIQQIGISQESFAVWFRGENQGPSWF